VGASGREGKRGVMGAREKGREGKCDAIGGGGGMFVEEAALVRDLGARAMVEELGLVRKTGAEKMVNERELTGEIGETGAEVMAEGAQA